ncbi:RNA 2'-phosphotransferase [uncultured Clostridium sp.]|uniref:RNA 2'-phosphotransferase n=1 Tax=uncultured Clostridium sp. TaxID=59620 RepID=UPI00345C7DC3
MFHGTSKRFLSSICKKGLLKGKRLYVHLSKDFETANEVSKRHGNEMVLIINTRRMVEEGHKFYMSENGVYLCEHVPHQYIIY